MTTIRTIFAALLFLAAPLVHAQPYLFAGAASSWSAGDGQVAKDRSDLFLSPGIGYRFSQYIAVEAAYLNPGTVLSTFTQSTPAAGQTFATMRDIDVSGSRLTLVGSMPLVDRLSLLGSVSIYRLKATASEVDTLTVSAPPSQTVTGMRTVSGTSSTTGAGLGLNYQLTSNVDGRMTLEWVSGKNDFIAQGEDLPKLRVLSFSLAYRF